ncbi:MAG: ABC transporter permease [Balneolia bacterium]|nr:ABC transporter permease [Balneolia bacterium]
MRASEMEGGLMNNQLKTVWNVTKWEYTRFFKWIDLIKGTVFFLAFGLIGGVIGFWVASDTITTPDIAVHEYGDFSSENFQSSQFTFSDRSEDAMDVLLEELEAGDLDGILTIVSTDSATIRMKGERGWLTGLRQHLREQRTDLKLQEFDIDASVFAAIEDGMVLHTEFDRGSESSSADKWLAGIAIFLILMAVFMGFAYQFTAITGEKQQRITEQVISAISPQTWIDGKILGITGIGLTYVVYYGGLGLIGMVALINFTGAPFGQALVLINPGLLILFLLLSILGILMINSFFAGIAATIDDPNTSQKSALMMIPLYPVLFAFVAIFNADSTAIQILAVFPLTSYAILPVRLVMTQVPWWEPVVALVLLAATAWLFRVWAGKIFATGMMMYGKEPSLREMVHWFRRA